MVTDINLTFGKGDFQVNALKQFLLDIAPILNEVDSNKIIFVGHSLGGYLAVIAMQFCDTIDRSLNTQFNTIEFRASQVYTFNSPAIDGIDNMFKRALAALLGKNIMEYVLNPQKVYCVYDSGGVKIIASAQYGSHNRIPIYTGKNSHSIIPLTQTLYFYSYLLELESNAEILQANSNDISKSLESLNAVSDAIQRNLEDVASQEYSKKILEDVARYGSIEMSSATRVLKSQVPHYLYATIDKTLFEATLHTKQTKLEVNNDNVIEGILYLQENNVFLQLLTKETMQDAATNKASRESNLPILLAIHERLFFVSVVKQNNNTQALIQTKTNITTLLGYNAPRSKIFCYNLEHIDEMVMKGYLNNALNFYPSSI